MPRNPAEDVGAVIAMSLGKNRFAYGRIAEDVTMQVFNLLTIGLLPAESVVEYPVAFWTAFQNNGFKDGRWKRIGRVPFQKKKDAIAPPFCIDNSHITPGDFQISHKGRVRRATPEEVVGLEREVFYRAEELEGEIRQRIKGKPIRVRDGKRET
jgi:hypothetical protein